MDSWERKVNIELVGAEQEHNVRYANPFSLSQLCNYWISEKSLIFILHLIRVIRSDLSRMCPTVRTSLSDGTDSLFFISDRSTPLGHFGRFAEYSIVWNANFEFSCTTLVCLLHGIISSGDVDGRLGGCGDCITNVWQEEDDCIFEYLIHYFPLLRGLRIKSR
jgi:hypothetical protein